MDFSKFNLNVNQEEINRQLEEAKNNAPQSDREVEPGTYRVKIEKMELGATRDGRPMFKVQCRIKQGDYKKWCIFMNRVVAGTKNDMNMINSVLGWLGSLDPQNTVPTFDGNYNHFADMILDIYEEIADAVEYIVEYDPDEFNNISIVEVIDL